MANSEDKTVLVTGGAGYLGSTLVPLLLSRGRKVRVLDSLIHGGFGLLGCWGHPSLEFRLGDIRDKQAVASAVEGVDQVVHLAAIVGDPACARTPDVAWDVNLEASLFLLNCAGRAGVQRMVFASTCSNYGKMTEADGWVDENSPLTPVSLYARTKVEFERALLAQPASFCGVPLRFATVFGVSPRMRFDLTVNEFTLEMLLERALVVYGEQFWRPYVHVRDAAAAIEKVLGAPEDAVRGQVFNVGSTAENYQKRQIVDLIRKWAPDAAVQYVHRDEDPRDYRVCFSRIEQKLGFRATRTVPQGIAEVAGLISGGVLQDWRGAHYRN